MKLKIEKIAGKTLTFPGFIASVAKIYAVFFADMC